MTHRIHLIWLLLAALFLPNCGGGSTRAIITDLTHTHQSAQSFAYQGTLRGEDHRCGGFVDPAGLATDVHGNLYVIDTGNHRVCKFDSQLNFVMEFGRFGWDAGELQSPTDLVVDKGVHLYIVDSGNRRIEKYNHEGAHIGTLFAEADAPSETPFLDLGAISFDPQGLLYVTDRENDVVLRLDLFGTLLDQWGGFGYEPGQFNQPVGVWVSPRSDVFVAEAGNNRIQVFNAVGNVVRQLPLPADFEPAALTGDPRGNLYIADGASGAIQVTTRHGDPLLTIDATGTALQQPTDLAIRSDGTLFIADGETNRVHMVRVEYDGIPGE